MRERVGEDAVKLIGRGLANGGDEERTGFKRRVVGIGQIEDGELRARRLTEPALQEGRDERGSGGPAFNGGVILRNSVERGVGRLMRGAHGKEEAGRFKAESWLVKAGRGNAGNIGTGG